MKPGNSVEDKTLMIRRKKFYAWLLAERPANRGSRERKVIVIRLMGYVMRRARKRKKGLPNRNLFLIHIFRYLNAKAFRLGRCPAHDKVTRCVVTIGINRLIAEK